MYTYTYGISHKKRLLVVLLPLPAAAVVYNIVFCEPLARVHTQNMKR